MILAPADLDTSRPVSHALTWTGRPAGMSANIDPQTIYNLAEDVTAPVAHLHEQFGDLVVSRCCNGKLFCHVCSTNLCFRMGPGCPELDPIAADIELVGHPY